MSKPISDEEIGGIAKKHRLECEPCDYSFVEQGAEAQRDSSDREWMEKLENQALRSDNYYSWGQKFLLSDFRQALKRRYHDNRRG